MIKIKMEKNHPAIRPCGDIVRTSLCTSQRRRMYVPSETLNDVWLERHQDVSMVRLRYVVLQRRDDVLNGCNNDVPSVRLQEDSSKSQMKHPTMSQWYVIKTSQWYLSTTSHYYVPATSPVSPK